MSETVSAAQKKNDGIELEYFKGSLAKRFVAFLIDMFFFSIVTIGVFCLLRLCVENTSGYRSAFETYVTISKDSKLYTYQETEDNLVKITTYAKGTYSDDYAKQVEFCESRLTEFYVEDPIGIFEGDEGSRLYNAEKIGDKAYKLSDGSSYFAYDSEGSIKSIVSDETLMGFYDDAIISAIQYLSRSEAYTNASKTLSKTINIALIPASITVGMIIFEFLVPLIFFRRGYQTLGMKLLKLSLINGYAVSPSFKSFLFRFLWILIIETLVSLMTFAVPLFITFGMVLIRKDGQAFHDYMTGIYVVDSSDRTIYRSKEEYLSLQQQAELTESRPYLSTWHGDHLDDGKSLQDSNKNDTNVTNEKNSID